MISELYTTGAGTRMRASYGNIHNYHNNRSSFGANRAVSLDQYSANNRRMSDGLQQVTSDNNVYYKQHHLHQHHQQQHRSLDTEVPATITENVKLSLAPDDTLGKSHPPPSPPRPLHLTRSYVCFQRSANNISSKSINSNNNTNTVRVNCWAVHRRPPTMAPNHSCHVCVNSPVALVSASIANPNETTSHRIRTHRETTIQMNRPPSRRAVSVVQTKCQRRRSTIKRTNSTTARHQPPYNRTYWVRPLWPRPHNRQRRQRQPHGIEPTVSMCRCVRDTAAVPVAAATVANRHATMTTITWPGPTTIIVITQQSGIIKVLPMATKARWRAIAFDIKV